MKLENSDGVREARDGYCFPNDAADLLDHQRKNSKIDSHAVAIDPSTALLW